MDRADIQSGAVEEVLGPLFLGCNRWLFAIGIGR